MEKIASQMLDKLKTWVDENPELVKTTLLTSGLGAAAAAALTGKESEHERTSTRVKRRIRNALFGALAAGGSVGLLHYAGKNIANAKLKNAPTPEEKFDKAIDDTTNAVGGALLSPLALTGAGVYGAKKGLSRSLDKTHNRAARLTKSIMSGIEDVNKANAKVGKPILANLQGVLGKDPKDVSDAAKILKNNFNADAVRAYVNTLQGSQKENMYKLLREAGFDFAENAPKNMKFHSKLLAKLHGIGRRNWRVGAGAALGTGAMAGLGALISNLSED